MLTPDSPLSQFILHEGPYVLLAVGYILVFIGARKMLATRPRWWHTRVTVASLALVFATVFQLVSHPPFY